MTELEKELHLIKRYAEKQKKSHVDLKLDGVHLGRIVLHEGELEDFHHVDDGEEEKQDKSTSSIDGAKEWMVYLWSFKEDSVKIQFRVDKGDNTSPPVILKRLGEIWGQKMYLPRIVERYLSRQLTSSLVYER